MTSLTEEELAAAVKKIADLDANKRDASAPIADCPFCKMPPYYRESDEMLNGEGEIEVLCIYNHCPIGGIGIPLSKWQVLQADTRASLPRVSVEEVERLLYAEDPAYYSNGAVVPLEDAAPPYREAVLRQAQALRSKFPQWIKE